MKIIAHSRWVISVALLGSTCLSFQVGAEESAQAAATHGGEIFGSVAAVDSQELAISRGGTEVVVNDLLTAGEVNNNKASHLTTGNNYISDGSFAGATGFPTVVQNSGNNVLIQNATIVNLQVK